MTIRVTPLDEGNVVELSQGSNIFEKQILPWGKFHYKGDTFEITPAWADQAIKAFSDKAFDQTPFALADERNSHDVDHRPDRFGGEVLGFVKRATGLNAVLQLTSKAANMVRENKKLGVSVRFHEGYTRDSDQRSWPVVIDQVLGTLKPRLTGMAPWKEIVLSDLDEGTQVADSSNEEWVMTKPVTGDNTNDKDNGTPKSDNTNPVDGSAGATTDADKVTLSTKEYQQFQDLLKRLGDGGGNSSHANNDGGTVDDTDLNDILDDLEGKKDKEPTPVGLSEDRKRIIKLSNEVAAANFQRDALAWKQAGVPPKLVELAAPVLSSYDEVRVVSLSDDGTEKSVDARTIVRSILDECKGTIALAVEEGHAQGAGSDQDENFKKSYQAFLDEVNQF